MSYIHQRMRVIYITRFRQPCLPYCTFKRYPARPIFVQTSQQQQESALTPLQKKQKRKQEKNAIDYSQVNQRHVAFKILYLGWDYHGMAWQESADDTIEVRLYNMFSISGGCCWFSLRCAYVGR